MEGCIDQQTVGSKLSVAGSSKNHVVSGGIKRQASTKENNNGTSLP